MAPYAVSKAGAEQLGRALRAELAPGEATAGVVYYGFIETDMVKQSLEDPIAARFESEHVPGFVRRRLSAAQAAEALVSGIERRAPRVFAPFYLRPYSALRGVLNPLIDRRLERDAALQALVREGDVERREHEAGGLT
jgi:NAD(P)-dependent dehydrogenase (short-subunit alcohol dehydrogenase family)